MKVSFIVPAYKAKFLKKAIESILAQSFSDFELIIVDDASPENIRQIVSGFDDARISYFRNEHNIGETSLVKQWNHCLQYAKGEYLILAADDDLYAPRFLEQCLALAEKYPQVDVIRSGVEQIDENDSLIGIDGVLPQYCSKYQYVYYWKNATVFTCMGNYMFKTEALKKKRFIEFPFAFGSDIASTIDMAENGMANTEEMLFKFRISSIHLSSNKGYLKQKLEAITMLFTWLKNLNYTEPNNPIDKFCYHHIQWSCLYPKCKYDYYNLVIKNLGFSDLNQINKCTLLTPKDRYGMILRYIRDKFLK
ncbi:glycosyltransferase family 2 protein [Elizabethkingia argenteiflava]|nr:glycosyltransferase family 2 protein [Elizabethkingia argenteiflava]